MPLRKALIFCVELLQIQVASWVRVIGFLSFKLWLLLEGKGHDTEVFLFMLFCGWYNIQSVW